MYTDDERYSSIIKGDKKGAKFQKMDCFKNKNNKEDSNMQ